LIIDKDAECLMFIDELRTVAGSGELIQQMEEFDFASAAETLEKLKIREYGGK